VTITEPAAGSSVAEGDKVIAGGGDAFPDLGDDPTGAGDHPTQRRVQVSVDDPDFGSPIEATLDGKTGTWSAPLGTLTPGRHKVYARAAQDRTTSQVESSEFTVEPKTSVQWQIVGRNQAPAADGWRRADGVTNWRFAFDTAAYGPGAKTIITRLVHDDLEIARASVRARFS
jgi:hypothetical protein